VTKSKIQRVLTALAAVITAAALATGCSSKAESTDKAADSGSKSDTASSAFPVTLHNAFGDVTLKAAPKRVATLGYADVGLASKMGANIVLAPKSFTALVHPNGEKNLPYVQPLPKDTVWINPVKVNVEQVAAAKPDLILATAGFSLDKAMYQQLSDIAPVVTYEKGLYQASSEDSAKRVATALGKPKEATRLIKEADDAVEKTKKDLPNLQGGTFLYGQARDGVVVMIVDKKNIAVEFMERLGLTPLPAVANLGGKGSVPGSIDVSFEKAGLFNDAGVLLMTYQSDALKKNFETNPIVSKQPIMKSRYFEVDLEAATALQDPNLASIPWLLKDIRPALKLIPAK
jgi:iron complex transport system substrate-binding protein